MRSQTLGNKRDFLSSVFRNKESATAITKGRPVILKMDGTQDGLAVVLPSTAGATHTRMYRFGISINESVPVNEFGNAQLWGLCNYAVLVRQTRAASTDTWASEDTLGKSLALAINTVANALSTAASSSTQASNAAVSLSAPQFDAIVAILAETLASYASSASSTADTRTAITAAVKVFLRML